MTPDLILMIGGGVVMFLIVLLMMGGSEPSGALKKRLDRVGGTTPAKSL